jgi:hypothetical protein
MSYTKNKYLLIIILGLLFLMPKIVNAKGNKNERTRPAKTSGSQIANARIDINNLNALESNIGFSDYNLNSNLEGTEFPRGSGKNAVYAAGFLWGGYVTGDNQVRVGGSAYISGLEPGPILADGHPANPTDSKWSIYSVRKDVYPGGPAVDLTAEVNAYAEGGQSVTASSLRSQYESDWTNWPAAGTANNLGAPFQDVNHDGKYEPNIDIPGVPGSDQTNYFVANDEDPSLTTGLYGTQPLGIEVHVTYWAYAQQGALGNMYFKKWDIINKGYQKYTIDSMFVSFWTDVDLGYSGDDLDGNDTTLSLQYVYNGAATDAVYAPLPPPADGFDFFQGPAVPSVPTDSAIFIEPPFNFTYIHGKKNLPMTAAYFFVNGDANFGDPPQGTPDGSTQFYNFFNGNYGLSGKPFINPITNQPTKYAFTGDPTTGQGWLDGVTLPPGDRREGMASGPFNLAPGDTQEVVVAEMFGGAIPGVDRLSAISLVKFYDVTAQQSYNNFFQIPLPPPPPSVSVVQSQNKIVLDWGEDASKVSATENYNSLGYTFEGYNVYQLPSAAATIAEGKRLATFDKIDGVLKIEDQFFDVNSGVVLEHVSEFGNDTGIQRSFVDSTDVFNSGKALIDGVKYYFAVTAYGYNANGVPHAIENPISLITVTPQMPPPGVTSQPLGPMSNVTHTGTANASVKVTVVNPNDVTGDQYKVSFHNEAYSLGSDGKWTDITAASKKLNKNTDLTGSSLTSSAAWSETKGAFVIHYIVNVVSPNYDYCDGVKIQLPAGIVIDTAYQPISNNSGDPIPYTLDRSTNTLFYSTINPDSLMSGDSTHRSTNGVFAGGEDIQVVVHPSNLPIITNYTMYDDNWGDMNGYYGGFIDVSGKDTLTKISNQIITQHQWNVTDATTGNIVLKNQTIYNGVDVYAPDLYKSQTGLNGPGGSSGSKIPNVGVGANVIFDGIQLSVNGNFTAPTTIGGLTLNGDPLGIDASNSRFDLTDFTVFGYDGTAANTLPLYGGAGGTTDISQLQQDYELKWTGVMGDTIINGKHVEIVKSGGSMATLFGASGYSIADHPLNPNPGTKKPFLIRIPFEVWNTTKNEQVNLLVWDRLGDISADTFYVWNINNRMYTWTVNTKYNAAVIDPTSQVVSDSATWNWVFFKSTFKTGDDIMITYNNPLQIGKDTFTFTVPKSSYSTALAKQDVSKINVFPNPYYGVNSLETTKYARFVTFSHLPSTATIHIFNLAGVMVKTIQHTNGTQFQTWDLTNDSNLPVASGLYIAYIDMPGIGATRILKLAIIQEQQFPDHF